jgi:hypothetical protein
MDSPLFCCYYSLVPPQHEKSPMTITEVVIENGSTTVLHLYRFEGWSEEAKERAIDSNRFVEVEDIEWWEGVYDMAREIGLTIRSFELDRRSYVNGDFDFGILETIKEIKNNFDKESHLYATAAKWRTTVFKAFVKYKLSLDIRSEEYENYTTADFLADFLATEEAEELESEFRKEVREDFRIMLSKEYDYLTSDKCITEWLKESDWLFLEDGKEAP